MSRMFTRTFPYGSYGASNGANTATRTAIPSIAAPMRPMRWRRNERHARRGGTAAAGAVTSISTLIGSSFAHARIEPAVDQLGDEVGHHDGQRDQKERALQHRVVAIGNSVDGQRAEAGPRVHRLDLDCSGNGEAQ